LSTALLALGLGLALAPGARAAWMIPPAPYRPKDFAVVKKDGLYHLFYIRRNVTLPIQDTENDLGHAVSPDLFTWTQLPPVVPARPGQWDNHHIWAPSIVERDGVYYLFYTGVAESAGVYNEWQRIGVATSTDLETWNQFDQPVFSCPQVPWSFCDPIEALTAFRDPFVMADPTTAGGYLMYYTGTLAHDSTRTVVGAARSGGDPFAWTDVQPMLATHQEYSGNVLTESPHVFQHDSLWYLFFTGGTSQPITFMTGPDPLGGPANWTQRGSLGTMLGQNTFAWFASEYERDGLVDYFWFVNADRIQPNRMVWQPDGTFQLVQPSSFHVVSLRWESDTVASGHPALLRFATANGTGQIAKLAASVLDSTGAEIPAPLDSLGLPLNLTLPADSSDFTWYARRWPATGATPTRVLVRLADETAATPRSIVVLPDTTTPPAFHVTGLAWADSQVTDGDVVALRISSVAGAGHSIPLAAFVRDSTGALVAAPLDSLGFPAQVSLSGDVTSLFWTSRLYPTAGGPRETRVVVGVAGDTLRSGDCDVRVAFPGVTGIDWSADSVAVDSLVFLRILNQGPTGQVVSLTGATVDSTGIEHWVSLSSLGLPFSMQVTGDTTSFAWTSRIQPSGATCMRLRVRIADMDLETRVLKVFRPTAAPPPDSFRVMGLAWSPDTLRRGSSATLRVFAAFGAGHFVALGAATVDSLGQDTAVAPASLGLPDSLALAADTTSLAWIARTWPDTSRVTRVRVKVLGDSLESGTLVVLPDSTLVAGVSAPPGPPGGSDGDPMGVGELPVRLRTAPRSALGAATVFVVDLAAPTPARLEVFDLGGRRLCVLADRVLPKGASVLPWDGRGGDGRAARAGVYFARLTTPRGTRVARAVVLR